MGRDLSKIKVDDPFDALRDPALPSLSWALDRAEAKAAFKRGLPGLAGPHGQVIVKSIRVIRHKPGKRCVIEYDVRIEAPDQPRTKAVLIGKVRARRFGHEALRLQEAIWQAGFQAGCPDGIAVPEPIGMIPRFKMWLQRKVPGEPTTTLLGGSAGVTLARRIAEGIDKLHRRGVLVERTHSMADELRILRECLRRVSQAHPGWTVRLQRILDACERLGASVRAPAPCGIHRDFYPAQVIADGPQLYLLDFDLYCVGDPALDVGNFLGHIIEDSLRGLGRPDGMRDREQALEERFLELAGAPARVGVHVYTTLTLVRHIYLSTQFRDRTTTTEPLLELCEERLGLASRGNCRVAIP